MFGKSSTIKSKSIPVQSGVLFVILRREFCRWIWFSLLFGLSVSPDVRSLRSGKMFPSWRAVGILSTFCLRAWEYSALWSSKRFEVNRNLVINETFVCAKCSNNIDDLLFSGEGLIQLYFLNSHNSTCADRIWAGCLIAHNVWNV